MMEAGPVGEPSTTDTHWDEKGNTMISHIFVSFSSSYITSIQFGYFENGTLVMSAKYGGPSKGQNFRVVKLKHNEYVTGLSGVLTRPALIKSLTFNTNLGKHGPIGDPTVPKFSPYSGIAFDLSICECDRREFGGSFGSCNDKYLTSIGAYINPIPSSNTAVKRENV